MIVRAHHRLTPRRIAIIAAVLLLTLVSGRIITQTVWASSSVSRSGQHVLRIYDDGSEKGVLTDADTLREALEAAGVTLDKNDITEPSLDSELVAAAYDVNIYRARPVMVVDGDTTTKVITPYRTAKQIAKQADIELRKEDRVQVEHGGDVVLDGALERLVIDRAHEITLVFYGEKTTLFTHADTVGRLLAERNIELGKNDTVSVPVDTPITPGMTIELWRDGVQTVTVTEKIKRPVRQIHDADRKVGFRQVRTEGSDGQRRVTYEITMKSGKEVGRKEVAAVVVTEAVEQVVVVGTKNNYSDSLNEWLLALRTCEARANLYDTNTGNGFYGAYQFMASTWNRTAAAIGRHDLVGVLPHKASPADQDLMVIANTKRSSGGLATQHPGCYKKLGLSQFPPES